MDRIEGLKHCENLPGEILTLEEVSEKLKERYPIVVRAVSKESETAASQDLPGDSEIMLEKPRWLQFVLVRVLDFIDEEKIKKEKGEDFVMEHKACVGKEFLIPVCYPGTFKLLNKPGRHSRYVSVSQIINDLPRYITINQETTYAPPDQPHVTSRLPAGIKLEVENVQIVGEIRYIRCKSLKMTYIFREDFPINCSAVDDPDEHTLLSLASEFVLLPKNAQFENVWQDDIVLKNDEEASSLLTLFDGPLQILKSSIRRNVYIAWMKREGTHRQTVGLVPRHIWTNQLVQVKTFQNETNKQEYIQQHYGDNLDSSFVVNGLYMLKKVQTNIIWLTGPTPKTKAQISVSDEPNRLLCVEKPQKEDKLKTIKETLRLGFDKVHGQLLKRPKQKHHAVLTSQCLKSKSDRTGDSNVAEGRKLSSPKDDCTEDDARRSNQLLIAYEQKQNRPVPALPPKSINVTDDDKSKIYDKVEDNTINFKGIKTDGKKDPANKIATLARYPNLHNIGKDAQSREDFYSCTVEELVECLKLCKLDKFAKICSENKLDGAFFRNFELNQLQFDPFSINNIDVVKVKKIIEEGWRPKLDVMKYS